MAPKPSDVRFKVDPADISPEKAARRLHLTLARFTEVLPDLIKRGFPPADETTGMYDLEAIDLWRRSRHRPSAELTAAPVSPSISPVDDKVERFLAAKERQAQNRGRHRGAA
jgi:hypothetical protein